MTTLISSHWTWGSWWKRILRKRTHYHHLVKEGAESAFWKFEELNKTWSVVDPGEYYDSLGGGGVD